MEGSPAAAKKRSPFLIILLILLGLALLTFVLDAAGFDVVGQRETDTMIERPHR